MKLQPAKFFMDWLQQGNYKAFYLAFLRVAISCWLLKELCFNWTSMDLLYGESAFTVSRPNLISRLPGGGFELLKTHYRWFIFPYLGVILLNIVGIGRWLTALMLFLMVNILQKMNISFTDTGDLMARQILLFLIFANSYQYFVLIKQKRVDGHQLRLQNLFSNLAAFSMMLQLCLAYFQSGIAKLNEPLWQQGEATYYALLMERYMGTPFNKYIAQYRWFDIATNYAVLLFELGFPLLVWIKKFRKPLLVAGVLLHLCIYIFLMIYGFQVIFVFIYGLFLPNQQLVDLVYSRPLRWWKKYRMKQ